MQAQKNLMMQRHAAGLVGGQDAMAQYYASRGQAGSGSESQRMMEYISQMSL